MPTRGQKETAFTQRTPLTGIIDSVTLVAFESVRQKNTTDKHHWECHTQRTPLTSTTESVTLVACITCTRNTSRASTGLYTPAALAMKGLALALARVLATSTPTCSGACTGVRVHNTVEEKRGKSAGNIQKRRGSKWVLGAWAITFWPNSCKGTLSFMHCPTWRGYNL